MFSKQTYPKIKIKIKKKKLVHFDISLRLWFLTSSS